MRSIQDGGKGIGVRTLIFTAVTLVLGSVVALIAGVAVLPRIASSERDGVPGDLDGALVDRIVGTTLQLLDPPDLDAVPGTRNRARRQPPPLLSEAEVEAGLGVRLQRMHEKQAARILRRSRPQRGLRADGSDEPSFDQDPPRQPEQPPLPPSLAQ